MRREQAEAAHPFLLLRGLCPFPLLLAEQEALDFAAGRLGQGVDELDLARVGMGRESLLDKLLEFSGQLRCWFMA